MRDRTIRAGVQVRTRRGIASVGVAAIVSAAAFAAPGASADTATPTTRASVSSDGLEGDGDSHGAVVSTDGRYVAFISAAANLVPNDNNQAEDVFVRDTLNGTTTRVSVSTAGDERDNGSIYYISMTPDGRYVAFETLASFAANDTISYTDIYVRDTQSNNTTLVSVNSDGQPGNGHSQQPRISDDGRYVAFASTANNLTGEYDSNARSDIFVRDMVAGTTTRVSVTSAGSQANGGSYSPTLSADGRYVAFQSDAALVPKDTNGTDDVYVRDTEKGVTQRVSVKPTGGQANGRSGGPAISSDGRYIAFQSAASNMVPDDTNDLSDVFVRDRQAGTTTRVSVTSSGAESTAGYAGAGNPEMSADGRYISFVSQAGDLVENDDNNWYDVFVHDMATGTTTRASVNSYGVGGNAGGEDGSISTGGQFVVFDSLSDNLVSNDGNGARDAFVHDTTAPLIPAADISVTNITHATAVNPGDPITYTITVQNNGPVVAEAVKLKDRLSSYTSFISATPTKGTCEGTAPVICRLGSMAPGSTQTVTLVVIATNGTGAAVKAVNKASVTTRSTDPDLSNNAATATTKIRA